MLIFPIVHESLRRFDVSGACNGLKYGLNHFWEKRGHRFKLRKVTLFTVFLLTWLLFFGR